MELTNQVTALQDEVKLLKAEIKGILKEIRTAVLSQDNPFSAAPSLSVLGGSIQSNVAARGAQPQAEPPEADTASVTIPTFGGANNQPSQPAPIIIAGGPLPTPAWAGVQPASQPAPPPVAEPVPTAPRPPATEPVASGDPVPAGGPPEKAPVPIRPDVDVDENRDTGDSPAEDRQPWTLSTVAGLAVWAEEAIAALGPRRYRFVLELSAFANLLSLEERDVLAGLAEAAAPSWDDDGPLNVNECLVVLRQLDAVAHGERVLKLPRRRGLRHRRVR